MAPTADTQHPVGERGVQDDFGWALAAVLRAYGRATDRQLAAVPGGARGYRLLCAVVRDCPRSQLALAQHIGLDKTVVTYLVDDLAAAGLLERRPDPADRRTRRVLATDAGRDLLCRLDAELEAVEDTLLGALDADDRAAFRRLLHRVAVSAGQDTGAMTCAEADRLLTADG